MSKRFSCGNIWKYPPPIHTDAYRAACIYAISLANSSGLDVVISHCSEMGECGFTVRLADGNSNDYARGEIVNPRTPSGS